MIWSPATSRDVKCVVTRFLEKNVCNLREVFPSHRPAVKNLQNRRDNWIAAPTSRRRGHVDDKSAISQDMIREARNGDELAINALLNHYQNYLKLLADTQLARGVRRRVSASDVVQEALLDAFKQFENFRGTEPPQLVAWLRTILARRLADKLRFHHADKRDLRRERALEEALLQSSIIVERALASSDPSVTSKAIQAENAVELANAFDRLPAEYREVIMRREVQKQSFADVSEQMMRSPGAVRMLWVRALERLRREMKAGGDAS